MKAYQIDATKQTVCAVEYETLQELQALVGGSIEIAKSWPDGTTLYVDADGLDKAAGPEFWIEGNPWPLGSKAAVVGRELPDEPREDGGCVTRPPCMTLDELRAEITFKTQEQAKSWAKAHASEATVVINGEVVERVKDTYRY
jgi:hypothetical protein